MELPVPQQGLVLRYAYLWRREHRRGIEEGQKDRPCVIMLVEQVEAGSKVMLVPITHSPPAPEDVSAPLPPAVCAHLRLDSEQQWVILDEVNQFVWPGFDLRPLPWDGDRPDYGFLPPRFFDLLRDRLIAAFDDRRVGTVARD
jgi:hypothetical protein